MDSVLSLCMSPRLKVFRQHIREACLISRMVCCFTTSLVHQSGLTPLTLVWKGEACSQYVLDKDSEGHVPTEQHLQEDGKLSTSDDPPIVFAGLNSNLYRSQTCGQ